MNLQQKDLVLLPYPFANLKEVKVRPALIVSNDLFNMNCDNLIMVPLTSVIKDEAYSILISQKDMKSGNLVKPSRIRIDKLFSIERRLVQIKIGSLSNFSFDKVRKELIGAL